MMSKSTKKLKKLERDLCVRLDNDFDGLKRWRFFGTMQNGHLVIMITAKEKK